ncbi:MAG: hypothetical protein H7282_04910 [Cytophagaceae bacterium]|nr:hypothetical protein [Cytophagaceae bacterium]
MSKVITFSRHFPKGHPRQGEPTYFVEKYWNSFNVQALGEEFVYPFEEELYKLNKDRLGLWPLQDVTFDPPIISSMRESFGAKLHTIRAGNRFKEGEMFSPRVWSGKPYNSKQIVIGPDTKVVKTYEISIVCTGDKGFAVLDGQEFPLNNESMNAALLASNDGLTVGDLVAWFSKPMKGQIICWSDEVEYNHHVG